MPLTIASDGDRALPVVICDHCGEAICEGFDGYYEWLAPEEEPTPLRFVHRRCIRAFCVEHPAPAGSSWRWGPLDALPGLLGHRLGVNWKATRWLVATLQGR